MADEPIAGAGGAAAGGGSSGAGSGGGSGAPAGGAPAGGGNADAGLSDEAFLSKAHPAPAEGAEAATETPAEGAEQAQATEEVNLSLLEPGRPEWLAKVTDQAAKTEIEKILDFQKVVQERFKDAEALNNFFKDLPGGVEQVQALQLLSKEIAEDDLAIEAGTPKGLGTVAAKYLGMAKDGGAGLVRAAAQHLAKTQPEAWAQLGDELVSETLKSAGIGADFKTIAGAINEMRAAIVGDQNGTLTNEQANEAFGRAAGKLLGQPKADERSAADPRLTRAQQAEKDARAAEQTALGENWKTRDGKLGEQFKGEILGQVDKLFGDEKFMPKSISQETRADLKGKIYSEVLSQIVGNSYLAAQVTQLIGVARGADLSKANVRATQADFDKAFELLKGGANKDLVNRAVAKVVSAWAKERAGANKSAREQARGAAAKGKDIGAAPAVKSGYKPITEQEQANMTDEQLLAEYTRRRGVKV